MSSKEGVFGDNEDIEVRGTTLVLHFRAEVADMGQRVKRKEDILQGGQSNNPVKGPDGCRLWNCRNTGAF